VIFIHTSAYIFPAKWAKMTTGKKMKIVVRETQPNHLKTKQEWIGLSVSLLIADKVVFLSTEYRDAIKKKLSFFYSNKRTAVIPNGIDLAVYKPAPKTTANVINIGMQSRLSATKDHATLLEAFRIIINNNPLSQKIQLLIAGDGACREALEKQALELGLSDHILFLGMLEEKDLPGFINSLDIYVHATLGETMSTAIMQVMACKLPVIASDVLGVNNMIRHNDTGLLVPAKNQTALADAVLQLLTQPGLAAALAAKAFDFAKENYSNNTMLEKYKAVFNGQ
jgi:glycosyltransferase involved in cell wall biosynthesis